MSTNIQPSIETVFSLDTEENKTRVIKIVTSDDVIFNVEEKFLEQSTLTKIALEDKDCEDIKLSLVTSEQFAYVLDYIKQLDYNQGKFSTLPKPIVDTTLKTYLSEWELFFINKVHADHMLAKLAEASNYLDVKPLLDLVCAKIASLLKGKINSNDIDDIIKSL